MRTYNATYQGGSVVIEYPNAICFSRSKYSYIAVSAPTNASGSGSISVAITVGQASQSKTVSVQRSLLNKAGSRVVFPLSSIFDFLADVNKASSLHSRPYLSVKFNDTSLVTLDLDTIMIGYSDIEVEAMHNQSDPNNASNAPAPRKMALYPNLDEPVAVFIPENFRDSTQLIGYNSEGNVLDTYSQLPPFYKFNPSNVRWINENDSIYIKTTDSTARSNDIQVVIDTCTDGLFVKWTDMHGFPCLYRWSVETQSESIEVASSITQLNDNLQPREINNKTLVKTHTLHTRLIDQSLYDMCKSILTGRDIKYYDITTAEWRDCIIEEGEAEDNGEILKDLVIEISYKIYNL